MTTTINSTTYPVSVIELKDWVRVDHSSDDIMLTALIQAATSEAENRTWSQLTYRDYTIVLAGFPDDGESILLSGAPGTVTELAYNDGTDKTLTEGTDFEIVTDEDDGTWALEPTSADWPDNVVSVAISYKSGSATQPENIKTWILARAGSLYQQRVAITTGLSVEKIDDRFFDGLLDSHVAIGRLI